MGLRSLLPAVVLVGGAIAPLAANAQSASPVPYAGTPSTALLVTATNEPRWAVGSDGLRHLEYDLLVTNGFLAPATLTRVDALGPDGAVLATLQGDALLAATQPMLGDAPQAAVPPSGTVAVVMDVAVAPDAMPPTVGHRIAYDLPADAPDLALIASREVAGPTLTVATREPTVVASPLGGDGWVAFEGCCAASSVHRFERVPAGDHVAKAEMFAVDWVRLEDDLPATGDGSAVDQWFGYGAEVRSVADGTVVYARDDMPDQAPGATVRGIDRPEDFGGNQVIVQTAPDVYAFYAHLQPGSVAVRVGDTVTTGQPVGRLGNSGHSTAPHLHFGLLETPNDVTGMAVPFAIDDWTLAGTIDPAALAVSAATPGTGALPVAPANVPQQGTLPLFLTVANFK